MVKITEEICENCEMHGTITAPTVKSEHGYKAPCSKSSIVYYGPPIGVWSSNGNFDSSLGAIENHGITAVTEAVILCTCREYRDFCQMLWFCRDFRCF